MSKKIVYPAITAANLFELASRFQIRFDSTRGPITTEDLWGLPLKHQTRLNLDDIGKRIQQRMKSFDETAVDSLVDDEADDATSADKFDLNLQLAVIKHIIAFEKAQAEKEKAEKELNQERKEMLDLLHDAERNERSSMTKEQIRERIAALEARRAELAG
jgi:paraquat-inducible protein B